MPQWKLSTSVSGCTRGGDLHGCRYRHHLSEIHVLRCRLARGGDGGEARVRLGHDVRARANAQAEALDGGRDDCGNRQLLRQAEVRAQLLNLIHQCHLCCPGLRCRFSRCGWRLPGRAPSTVVPRALMHASAFAAMLIEATFRFETLTGCRDDCGHVQLVCYAKMRAEQLRLRSEGHALRLRLGRHPCSPHDA